MFEGAGAVMGKLLGSVMIVCWVAIFTSMVLSMPPVTTALAVAQIATVIFNICGGVMMLAVLWTT